MRILRFRRTTLIIVFSVAVVLGVATGAVASFALPEYVLIGAVCLVASLRSRSIVLAGSVLILGLMLGNWRGAQFAERLNVLNELYGQNITFSGTAQSDGVYSKNGQLSFDVGNIRVTDPVTRTIPGKIKVEGFGVNAVYRDDHVVVEGKLRDLLGARVGQVGFADVTVMQHHMDALGAIRHNFSSGVLTSMPEPQASFGLGLLLGDRTTLPKSTTDSLAKVGLTHIIAVSGYNLTIIILAARRLMAGRSRYQTIAVSICLLGAFSLLTGFSASIVRASIVSMFSLLAWYYGRKIRPLVLIVFTAAITAVWNPLYVWADAGWYLSFLAFSGVLIVAPAIHKRFWRHKNSKFFGSVMIESLCAQLMTVPYVMFTFSQLSLLALPVNIIIVPLVPLAMLLSLMAGLGGMLMTSLVGWVAWPATLLLTYMLDVVELFSRVPHVLVRRQLSLGGLVLLYGCLAVMVSAVVHAAQRGTITDRNTRNI